MPQSSLCLGCPDPRYVAGPVLNSCPGPDRLRIDGLSWFNDFISIAVKAAPEQLSVDVLYYVTDTTAAVDDGASIQSEKSKLGCRGVSKSSGRRPQLRTIVKDFCTEEGTVAIASAFSARSLLS